jgi:hypothetical protein
VVAPAGDERFLRAFFVAAGRLVDVRALPRGAGAIVEIEAGLRAARAATATLAPEHADELLLVGAFLRRPQPELTILPLDAARIAAACARLSVAASGVRAAG